MLRILQRRSPDLQVYVASFGNPFCDRGMHPIRVNLPDDRVFLLVNVFAPDQHSQW